MTLGSRVGEEAIFQSLQLRVAVNAGMRPTK